MRRDCGAFVFVRRNSLCVSPAAFQGAGERPGIGFVGQCELLKLVAVELRQAGHEILFVVLEIDLNAPVLLRHKTFDPSSRSAIMRNALCTRPADNPLRSSRAMAKD